MKTSQAVALSAMAALLFLNGSCTQKSENSPLPWLVNRDDAYKNLEQPAATIILMLDTLRPDYLGCYGSSNPTPNIDNFAKESVLFSRAYSTSTWTRPAIASIFTGLHPTTLGVHGSQDALPEQVLALGQIWSNNGHSAHGISTNSNAGVPWGFSRGFDSWSAPAHSGEGAIIHRAVDVVSEFNNLIERQPIERGDLLWLHFMDPHDPYYAPGENHLAADRDYLKELDRKPVSEKDKDYIKYLYANSVTYMDAHLGSLFERLRSIDLYDEALIILVSDHGEGLWDHGERYHIHKPHNEQIHVPLIVKPPKSWGVSPSQSSTVVSIIDIFPTLLEANNFSIPLSCQGVPLLLADGPEDRQRNLAYYSIERNGAFFDGTIGAQNKVISPVWEIGTPKTVASDGTQNMYQTIFAFYGRHSTVGNSSAEVIRVNKAILPSNYLASEVVPEGLLLTIPNLLPEYVTESYQRQKSDWMLSEKVHAKMLSQLHLIRDYDARNMLDPSRVEMNELDEDLLQNLQQLGYVDE